MTDYNQVFPTLCAPLDRKHAEEQLELFMSHCTAVTEFASGLFWRLDQPLTDIQGVLWLI